MSEKPTPAHPHADRTAADRGRPDEYPPDPPAEDSIIHHERQAQQSDNANSGKVTSRPPDKF